MLLFWEQGVEGTSMADLTQATGLNPSRIYTTFGDKRCREALGSRHSRGSFERSSTIRSLPHHAWSSADLYDADRSEWTGA